MTSYPAPAPAPAGAAGTGAPAPGAAAVRADGAEEWTPATPRLGPALIVAVIAVVIVGGGIGLAALFSNPKPIAAPARGRLPGEALSAEAAAPVLRHVASAGEPPADITAALVVPAGSVYRSRQPTSGLQLYSADVTMSVDAKPSEVLDFYRAELAHLHWSGITTDAAATGSGTEVLARHPSSDGFYWEVGATVSASMPSLSPALAGGTQHAPTSVLLLSLYEINDAD